MNFISYVHSVAAHPNKVHSKSIRSAPSNHMSWALRCQNSWDKIHKEINTIIFHWKLYDSEKSRWEFVSLKSIRFMAKCCQLWSFQWKWYECIMNFAKMNKINFKYADGCRQIFVCNFKSRLRLSSLNVYMWHNAFNVKRSCPHCFMTEWARKSLLARPDIKEFVQSTLKARWLWLDLFGRNHRVRETYYEKSRRKLREKMSRNVTQIVPTHNQISFVSNFFFCRVH